MLLAVLASWLHLHGPGSNSYGLALAPHETDSQYSLSPTLICRDNLTKARQTKPCHGTRQHIQYSVYGVTHAAPRAP